MSDKARGNALEMEEDVARHSKGDYGRGVIWQGRLGGAAMGRLNTPRYPREDSCALSPSF
jgi:hypothetical protein